MPLIIYVDHDGARRSHSVAAGTSVMIGARDNDVSGIVADCGGAAACATCRVFVDDAWAGRLPPAQPLEQSMLDAFEGEHPHQRLSCQITCTEALDGLVVHVPESQY